MIDIAERADGLDLQSARLDREVWSSDAGFYFVMSLVAATLIVLGFMPSFYLKSWIHAPPPLSSPWRVRM